MTTESMSGYCVNFSPSVGVGPVGANVPQTFVRAPTWMNTDNNIKSRQDCNSFPVFNINSYVPKDSNLSNNYYVNETGRGEVHPQNVEQLNLKGQDLFHNLSFVDQQKTTTKETTEFAYAGNAVQEEKGTEFWTYGDAPKTTTKETTEYAYVGNVVREDKGTEFWTYSDAPKTTTRETTEYAYTGNVARGDVANTSRNQYTGFDGDKKGGVRTGGADTYALRGSTLVENYTSGPSRQNLLSDAQARMGKINYGQFGSDQNYNGPGTLNQALPDAGKYQYQYILGKQKISPNRVQAVDDRQIAGYLVEQLQANPLSIFTNKPDNPIPGFNCDVQPENYSTMITTEETEKDTSGYQGINSTVQVYPTQNGKQFNPNTGIIYNKSLDSDGTNTFLQQGGRPNSVPEFTGKCYSGTPGFGWGSGGSPTDKQKISLGGKDEPDVAFGNLYQNVNIPEGMAQGTGCANGQLKEGNRALSFATSPQFITNLN